jgi:hypothetical protein
LNELVSSKVFMGKGVAMGKLFIAFLT